MNVIFPTYIASERSVLNDPETHRQPFSVPESWVVLAGSVCELPNAHTLSHLDMEELVCHLGRLAVAL
eukprot:1184803-Prorocentrum_minimum.AAC.1